MKNLNTSTPSQPSGCPFKRLNKRLQQSTKDSISKELTNKQINKHQTYVDLLKNSFEENEQYYLHIKDHITQEDKDEFGLIEENKRETFLNKKMKEYFWKGFIFEDKKNLSASETTFVKIGNLGLDDVSMIVEEVLLDKHSPLKEKLSRIDKEIDVRLKNNVLIDSIIHLEDFPDKEITKDKEKTAELIGSMIEENTIKKHNRYSLQLIAESFRDPMTKDGMIDEKGCIPQLTFGCPIINLKKGKVFKEFTRGFLEAFLSSEYTT